MASRYMKRSMFGTSSAQRKDDNAVDAATWIVTIGVKRHQGSSMSGHKTYKLNVTGKLLMLRSIKITLSNDYCTMRRIFSRGVVQIAI
jgi:3-phenylpropionate/cinnamic acid dioxygenase small subunit